MTNFKSSQGTSSATSEKNPFGLRAHYRKGQLSSCVPEIKRKIKTNWSNLHQEAKKTYTEKARDHQRTSGDPPSKPLPEDQERIVDIYDTLVNHALKTL